MSMVKIVLRSKVNKDGTSALALRITKGRKSSFVYLGYNLFPDQWDTKNQ
jgi:integrase/recombinase XerD